MENPALIEEISALASKKTENETENVVESEATPTAAEVNTHNLHSRREQLLSALKPYLSSERQKAIDSMMTFAEILDAVRGK